MNALIFAFIFYLIILVLIGIWSSRFNKTIDDFLLAGRKLGYVPVAISAEASDMSGWLALGLPGLAYNFGFGAIWAAIGSAFGTLFNWTFVARRLRRLSEKFHSLTLPDFLEDKFDDKSHFVRATSTGIIAIFMTAYTSAQFVAAGKILSETFGWSYEFALIIAVSIIAFYTLLGGFFAVAWTDVFQGMLIFFIMIFLPIIAFLNCGGLASNISKINPSALLPTFKYGGTLMLLFIIGHFSWFFGYPGQPHILTRYMAIDNEKNLKKSTLIGMIWVVVSLWGAVMIGIIGLASLSINDPERIMPILAMHTLPAWGAGIVIAAIMAAIMSTADSQLLVATSSFVEDIYRKIFHPDASEKKLMFLSRLFVVLISAFAFLMALQGGIIYLLVAFAWGGFAASFGPVIILSLWWKGMKKKGAIAGMLSGCIAVIAWESLGFSHYIYPGIFIPGVLPGFIISFVISILVSIMQRYDDFTSKH